MCVNVMLPKIVYFFSFKMFEVHVFKFKTVIRFIEEVYRMPTFLQYLKSY